MVHRWPAACANDKQVLVNQMRRRNRMTILLCAACLLIGLPHPGRSCADETAVISSTPASQVDPNSFRPSANIPVAPAPYQVEQNTNEVEPPGLKEYMD